MSRTDLAELTGISQPVITRLVRDLLADEVVAEIGAAGSSGGRRPVLLAIRSRSRWVLLARLARGRAELALADLTGTVVTHRRADYQGDRMELDWLVAELAELCRINGLDTADVCGVAVAVPGVVTPRTGVVGTAPDLGWTAPEPLGEVLANRFGDCVLVDNDVNLMLTGERVHGAARGADDVVLLYIGRFIGASIMLGGRVLPGAHGASGEIGLLPLRDSDSGSTVEQRYGLSGLADEIGAAEPVRELAESGRLDEVVSAWGHLVVALSLAVDPALVLVGGAATELGESGLVRIRSELGQRVPVCPDVRFAELGDRAVTQGALERIRDLVIDSGAIRP
ncbi:ROK family protein [Saccharopolyspora sp. WRP15-2]|uniref:ROK family protein n=1 Tax=Saccharopolyspora oryzae TaxID=2997343 RepID=A0ABT4UYH0_9PSEU|nr:ROK family protein [Saccharopolyspora oryzae]MDA3626613.1 ROK family protein [Saccharopolyspora oryzae]